MTPDPRRRFVLGPCLGRGGYGEVYRATTVSSGGLSSQVALKLVRAELDVAADAAARLRDEARLLARLAHPNIVRVIDLCRVTDDAGISRFALITELIEGRDLDHLRQPPDPIPPRAAVEAIARVARALDAAWSGAGAEGAPLRVVHRDVKPGNIAIGRHGDVKLLDFGIARFEGEEREARTATAMLVGSMPYLAPERFLEREAVPASDVFALGCVIFECATGQRWYDPIPTRGIPALASDRDRYEAWRWERLTSAALPEPLRPILVATLAWNHPDRPTAAVLADRLDAVELPGAGLRAWCRQRDWTDPPPAPGSLEGRVLFEVAGDAPKPATPSSVPMPISVLNLVHKPLPTIDPGGWSGASPALPAPAVVAAERRIAPVVASAVLARPARPIASLHGGTHFVPMMPTRIPQRAARAAPPPLHRAPRLFAAIGCATALILAIFVGLALAGALLGAIAWLG